MASDTIQTTECSLQELHSELAQPIRDYVSRGDKLLICCETTSKYGGGFLRSSDTLRSAAIITQSRLIMATYASSYPASVSNRVDSLFLADIISIWESSSADSHAVHVTARGDIHSSTSFASRQLATKFAAILRQAVEQVQARQQADAAAKDTDVLTQLERLGRLKTQGLLTDEEFKAAKSKLLGT